MPMLQFRPISRVIRVAWLSCLVSWSACSAKLPASVVIPDSRTLHPAVSCTWEERDGLPVNPTHCHYDPYRANIDLGYLRAILEDLDACRKMKF